jgi:multidrug resistance efflux pump
MRALETDKGRRSIVVIATTAVLLIGWGTWFTRAEVIQYEVTEKARVEVIRAAHPIDAPVAGKVTVNHLDLGVDVHAGDVVLELDSETERRRLVEEQARLKAITPELDALERTLQADERVLRDDDLATRTEVDEGRARQRAAEFQAHQSAEEAERASKLFDGGAIA